MTKQRFYFEIPQANVIDFVEAYSFTDAKAIAFNDYSHCWNQLIWHEIEHKQEASEQCTRLFF